MRITQKQMMGDSYTQVITSEVTTWVHSIHTMSITQPCALYSDIF